MRALAGQGSPDAVAAFLPNDPDFGGHREICIRLFAPPDCRASNCNGDDRCPLGCRVRGPHRAVQRILPASGSRPDLGAERAKRAGSGCMTPGLSLDHVLLTRFNLPSQGRERLVRAQNGWLRDRAELFENFCLPSVKAQTVKDVHWIIYFDPDSPAWLMEKIKEWAVEDTFVPVFRVSVSHDELIADLHNVVGPHRDRIITTNLDNDDGLAIDFLERLQQAAGKYEVRTALYLPQGLILGGNRLFLRTDRMNAFCSVVEPWQDPRTCWADWHNLLGKSMPTLEIPGPPAWLQVVHGGNVSNRVHGRLVPPRQHRERFPVIPADTHHPAGQELRWEFFVVIPLRFLRERGKLAVKSLAMLMLGKDGFSKAKDLLVATLAVPARRKSDATE